MGLKGFLFRFLSQNCSGHFLGDRRRHRRFHFFSRAQTNGVAKTNLTSDTLVMIQGSVKVARSGREIWSHGVLYQTLNPGDRVRTGEHTSFAWATSAVRPTSITLPSAKA
jgi:hypothetical protein